MSSIPMSSIEGRKIASSKVEEKEEDFMTTMTNRFVMTGEVAISKIFPAGAGWQLFATQAGEMGLQGSDVGFALMTGAGDFAGVLLGHNIYYTIKKMTGAKVDLNFQYKTGLFLASAAFFSGTVWQPVVNVLQAAELPWLAVASGTWMACGLSFYAGLRLFRQVYAPMGLVQPPHYGNLKSDAALSMSIGGATGAFVGTDMVYVPDQNPLINVVGVAPTDSTMIACGKAGASTALGFTASQAVQNLTYARGRNWTDAPKTKLMHPRQSYFKRTSAWKKA